MRSNNGLPETDFEPGEMCFISLAYSSETELQKKTS